jgi:uncharacterized protein HemX
MTVSKLTLVLLACSLLLGAGVYVQNKRVEAFKKELAAEKAERAKAEAALARLAKDLQAEREAADERAARLNSSEESHRELGRQLEVCDLDDDWDVPRALYERLCAPAPGT